MSEINQDYKDDIEWLDRIFRHTCLPWFDNVGKIDLTKRRPYSLDRLKKTAVQLLNAVLDFTIEIEQINEE